MSETRPTGEQLRFVSANTGEHILDTYLEAAEKGGRTLADMLSDIYDPTTGLFRTALFQFRITSDRKFQFRVGDFPDNVTGWTDINSNPSLFAAKGTWAATTAYAQTDIVTYNNSTYYCLTAHTSGATFSATNWAVMSDATALNAATSTASTSATAAAASATSASTSASTATTKATEASTSATNAAASATTASTQASTATTKATEASSSASQAASSASNAAASASTASTAATTATTKATEASNSASSASNSASTATTQATLATSKATDATNAASAAAADAATALTRMVGAETAANNAATSAAAALASEQGANTSAATAVTKAAEIQATYDANGNLVASAAIAVSAATSAAQSALVAAQYSVASGLDTATRNAQAAASLAQGYAASAASVVQQDLSGITAQALHRSPNAITAMAIYDTSKDSDGGAWTEKCQHTSWYNEPLSGKWLGAQYSELEARVVGSALGAENVSNGGFDTDTVWTKGAGWAIANGVATKTAGTASYLSQTSTFASGKLYRFEFTVSGRTAGTVGARLENATSASVRSFNGTYVEYFSSNSASPRIILSADASFNGSIDNVSVKEVTALNTASNDYFQLTTDGKFYRLWKNILSHTDALDNAAWSKTNATVTPNAATNPLSGLGAEALIEATDTNLAHSVSLTSFVGLTGTYTVSVALKANGRNWAVLNLTNVIGALSTNDIRAWFDLQNGVLGTVTGAGTAAIQSLGGGWYRCSITVTYSILANRRPVIFTSTGDGLYTHNGDGVSGLLIGGFQLEQSATATIYEPKAAEGSTSEVFRGNKADFPRLAAIVAEQSSLTIYDLTEPGRPMWMRFSAVGASNWWRSSTFITAFAIMNGFMVVGTAANYSYRAVDFAKDNLHDAMYAAQPAGGVGARNGAVVNGGPTWVVYGTASVNAIAMTVLPDAPMDPATGLRVPTIAVAANGVHLIKHNGTVVTSGLTNSYNHVYIDKNILMFSRTGSRGVYYSPNPGSLGFSFASSLMGSDPDQYQFQNPSVERFAGRACPMRFATPSVYRKWNHEALPARGLNMAVASGFNTGWLPGDIRRAYLSDVDAGSLVGANVIQNGDFSSGAAWTLSSGATISGGKVFFDLSVNVSPGISQTISGLAAGSLYRLRLTVSDLQGALAAFFVRFGDGSNQVAYYNPYAGNYEFLIYKGASSDSFSLAMAGGNATTRMAISNLTLETAVVDRSYKGRMAVVAGALSKSQLATGTSLVGYSGFSASNYLREAYSADLDFGTGEWSASAWVNIPATLSASSFPAIGSELITNGDFSSGATGWTAHASVTIGASAQFDGVTSLAPGVVLLTPSTPIVAVVGRFYRVTYTLTGNTLNGVSFYFGGVNGDVQFNAGTYTQIIRATGTDNFQIYTRAVTGVRAGGVDNISVVEVGPSAIFDRAFSSGARIRCGLTSNGTLTADAFDDTTTRTVTTTAAYNTATWLKAEACYTTDGTLSIRVNGREVATSRGNPLLSLNSRYNQLNWSEDFSSAAWTKSNATILANQVAAPDGTITADLLYPSSSGTLRWVYQATTLSANTYRRILFAKAQNKSILYIDPTGSGSTAAYYNLSTGQVISAPAGHTAGITAMADGWYMCTLDNTTATALSFGGVYGVADAGGSTSVTANGTDGIYIWGGDIRPLALASLPYQRTTTVAETNVAPLTIGNNFATDAPFPGSIALLKLSATVPTYEQSQFMYEQEKQLFRAGAQSVLPDSGSIVDMAYDDATDRWVAISATNESYWTGLVRNSVTPVPAGSYSRIVAGSGLELVARSTTNPGVDVTIPAYGLREELVKRAEAAARLTKEIVTYDYVGGFTANTTTGNTAITNVSTITYPASYIGARISGSGIPANTTIVAVSGTTIYLSAAATATATGVSISFLDFELPVGMEAKTVLSAGALRREGSTQDYTRLYDGFIETIRFAVAPGATAWVQIQAQRITLQ